MLSTIIRNMKTNESITGIILAGGKSSRMGSDKAMLTYNGKKLIEYSIGLMKLVCNTVIISASNANYLAFNLPMVSDNYSNIGPLAGLEASLRHSETRINLIAPCDNPFLNVEFLNTILNNSENYDAVIPISNDGKTEPLTGYYSREILPVIVQQIEKGDYKVQNLLKIIHTKYVLVTDKTLINNINTPNDLKSIVQK